MCALSYLWEWEDYTHGPGNSQHDFAFPLGLADSQRIEDGRLSVQAYDHGDERARVHGDEFQEHEQPASGVSSLPLHRDVPHRVDGHHDEGHQQVRHRQVHDQDPDVRLALAAVAGCPEHDQVTHRRHGAQAEGDDDSDFGRGGESGQLKRISVCALVAAWAGFCAALIHRRIRQLVEHGERAAAVRKLNVPLLAKQTHPNLNCEKKRQNKNVSSGFWLTALGGNPPAR